MQVGMLWLDDDKKRSLEEKIKRAADHYHNKYGEAPDLCIVNQRVVKEQIMVGKIEVRPALNILPSHFWLGVATR